MITVRCDKCNHNMEFCDRSMIKVFFKKYYAHNSEYHFCDLCNDDIKKELDALKKEYEAKREKIILNFTEEVI